MRFSDHLRITGNGIWQAQHDHPFVRGIGDGTLDVQRFGTWLQQDYLFLIDYARFFAAAILRAPSLDAMTTFSRLLHEILGREMELHRSYCAEFGISPLDLETATKLPTTQGYTDFLLRTATTNNYIELLGALLPCMWGYSEIASRIADRGLPADDRYRRWINVYADPEFGELAEWCRTLVDDACISISPDRIQRVESAFITSSRYELAFWDMAWKGETWLT
jgi:thiaminase/transcriptional activator TenA